jgi:hypothetical protein
MCTIVIVEEAETVAGAGVVVDANGELLVDIRVIPVVNYYWAVTD